MAKPKIFIIILIIGCLGAIFLLNAQVTSRKCIDYSCKTVEIPLYLKLLDFFDRHYSYKHLAVEITKDSKTQEETAVAVFDWVTSNLREVPEGFPVIDDHIWNIIIRGYGTNDQFCDVFATLCNYAGLEAIYLWVTASDGKSRIPLSLVKIDQRWSVFDPYNVFYFRSREGALAGINDLKSGDWIIEDTRGLNQPQYHLYFMNLPEINQMGLHRSNIQSPVRRLIYQIKRKLK